MQNSIGSRSEPPARSCEWPGCEARLFPFSLWSPSQQTHVWYPGDPFCEEHAAKAAADPLQGKVSAADPLAVSCEAVGIALRYTEPRQVVARF